MNTGRVLKMCFAVFTLASLTMPAFAVKTVPALGKAKAVQSMKIKCVKKGTSLSTKQKAIPVVSLKKNK